MTETEKNEQVYRLYATLGELSVLKKQTEQRLKMINTQVDEFEAKLVELLKTEIKESIDE